MFGALCAQSWRHSISKSSRLPSYLMRGHSCSASFILVSSSLLGWDWLDDFSVSRVENFDVWLSSSESDRYVTHVNSYVNPQENTIHQKYVDAENAQMILHFSSCSIQLVAPWLQPRCLKIRKENCSPPLSWPVSAPSTCIGPFVLLRIMLIHSPDCTYTPPSFF